MNASAHLTCTYGYQSFCNYGPHLTSDPNWQPHIWRQILESMHTKINISNAMWAAWKSPLCSEKGSMLEICWQSTFQTAQQCFKQQKYTEIKSSYTFSFKNYPYLCFNFKTKVTRNLDLQKITFRSTKNNYLWHSINWTEHGLYAHKIIQYTCAKTALLCSYDNSLLFRVLTWSPQEGGNIDESRATMWHKDGSHSKWHPFSQE